MTKIKVKSLTPEQTARFPEFVEKWTKLGLSTQPANRELAEEGVRKAYEIAGLKPPKIVWTQSPFGNALTRHIVQNLTKEDFEKLSIQPIQVGASVRASVRDSVWASVRDSVGDSVWASVRASVRASVWASVRDSVWDSVRASVWDSVWDSVRDSVWDSVRASVWDSVWDSVRASVWDSVGDSVWDSVRASVRDSVRASVEDSVWASVRDSVRASVRDSVRDSGYGQHDADYGAWFGYFREVCSLTEETDKWEGNRIISENAGWYLPHENICWICERHSTLKTDERGRLHCADGPALEYPDGWGIYAWHGIRLVGKEWIITNPELITPEKIFAEENAEIRRIMQERYGWQKFFLQMKESGKVKQVDQRDDISGLPVTLFAYYDGDISQHFVHVFNGTIEADGTRHEFTLNCKNINNNAFESVMGTYPDIMQILENHPNRMEILREAVRT